MTYTKFDNHPHASCAIVHWENDGDRYDGLQSYQTLVIATKHTGYGFSHQIYGLYSATTRKHIGWYAAFCGLAYSHFKWAYEHECDIYTYFDNNNVDFVSKITGEVIHTIVYRKF